MFRLSGVKITVCNWTGVKLRLSEKKLFSGLNSYKQITLIARLETKWFILFIVLLLTMSIERGLLILSVRSKIYIDSYQENFHHKFMIWNIHWIPSGCNINIQDEVTKWRVTHRIIVDYWSKFNLCRTKAWLV